MSAENTPWFPCKLVFNGFCAHLFSIAIWIAPTPWNPRTVMAKKTVVQARHTFQAYPWACTRRLGGLCCGQSYAHRHLFLTALSPMDFALETLLAFSNLTHDTSHLWLCVKRVQNPETYALLQTYFWKKEESLKSIVPHVLPVNSTLPFWECTHTHTHPQAT